MKILLCWLFGHYYLENENGVEDIFGVRWAKNCGRCERERVVDR